jgi:hypothetical protein
MCGGGGSKTVETQNKLPEWMDRGGEELFGHAQGAGFREFPLYGGDRIAGFSPDQMQGFDMVRDASGMWGPAMAQAMTFAGNAGTPVGEADIAQYMNPYTQNVIDNTVRQMQDNFSRENMARHDSMAQRGSYLNEDRREIIDAINRQTQGQAIGNVAGQLQHGAFTDALGQANITRNQQGQAAQMFGQFAPMISQLGYGDAAAMLDIGGQQQQQAQSNLDLGYQDFLNQFYYPQEQLNWMASILQGMPYSSTQSQPVGSNNLGGQLLGGGAMLGSAAIMAF